MKTLTLGLLSATLLTPSLSAGQSAPTTEDRAMRIIRTTEAQFPWMLSQQGVVEGWAVIAISVDAEGHLRDAMPVAYSRRAFADTAIEALKVWRYEPAYRRGEPWGSRVEVMFNFQAVGVVVSFDTAQYLNRLINEKPEYRPSSLRDLDRVPTPIVAPAPAYGKWLREQGISGDCVIDFFIDETGSVRLPAVASADFPELGILAVAAVETWKFEPPTSGNRPVLARVSQKFTFR